MKRLPVNLECPDDAMEQPTSIAPAVRRVDQLTGTTIRDVPGEVEEQPPTQPDPGTGAVIHGDNSGRKHRVLPVTVPGAKPRR
ncbi:hypothetical protein [Mycobacterium sp.]|uniref:hypothetical protein n=1 Tax=Mycobacterium sp. TaxID=1785 RepID=UPI003C716B85